MQLGQISGSGPNIHSLAPAEVREDLGEQHPFDLEMQAHCLRLMRSGNYTAKEITGAMQQAFPEVSDYDRRASIRSLTSRLLENG
jgi:hypothetical protein